VVSLRDCEEILMDKIGYRFIHPEYLREAMTHKSFSNEQVGATLPFNERLEFLGDAVLDLAVSETLFIQFPDLPEGEMTRIRAEVVNEKGLATVARQLEIGSCLLLGKGEDRSGGRDKDSLLADAMEALLGAVFWDVGYGAVKKIVASLFLDVIRRSARCKAGVDHKTRLQVFLQARHNRPPTYNLIRAEGPDHERQYTVEVCFDDRPIGHGTGRTKKAAEQEAAREALEKLEKA